MRHRSPGAAPLVCAAAVLFAPFLASPPSVATAAVAARAGAPAPVGAVPLAADTVAPFPYVEHVRICPQYYCDIRAVRPICPTDSIEVRIDGHFPSDCYTLKRVEVANWPSTAMGVPPPLIRLVVDDGGCLGRPCAQVPVPFETRVVTWPMAPGDYQLGIQVVTVSCDDSLVTRVGGPIQTYPFHVSDACGPPPQGCVLGGFTPPSTEGGCNAVVDPATGTASLGVTVRSPVPLAGLQGSFFIRGDGWAITDLEAVGPAAGMHLSWTRIEGGIRYVMFADQGAPIPATGPLEPVLPPTVLRMTIATRGTPPPATVTLGGMFGADIEGNGYEHCPTFAVIVASVCAEAASCDANGDGRTDVRDLVRMAQCLHSAACSDSARFDCDQDRDFDLDDVICCARHILRPPVCRECPPDTTGHPAPHVRMSWGTTRETPAGLEVPIRLEGAESVGAVRWTLRAPLASYDVIGIEREFGDAAWLPLIDASGTQVAIGLLYLGDDGLQPAPQEVGLVLKLALRPGQTPGGSLDPIGQDVSARDGSRLIAGPSPAPMALPGTPRLALSENWPEPFQGVTRFSVTVPEALPVDLAVFDIGGRRVQVIHRGELTAGTHDFSWNGRTSGGERARGGIYFVRAASRGAVVTRRVVLLGGD